MMWCMAVHVKLCCSMNGLLLHVYIYISTYIYLQSAREYCSLEEFACEFSTDFSNTACACFDAFFSCKRRSRSTTIEALEHICK